MKCVLRKKYTSSHTHSATSLANILNTYALDNIGHNLTHVTVLIGRALTAIEGLSFLEAPTNN